MLVDPGQEDRLRRGIPVVPVFDGYRAFAIFGIVFLHVSGLVTVPSGIADEYHRFVTATFGQLIDMLFIVSGFVVFLPTAVRGRFGSVPRYAVRRAARLLPAYYLILLVTVISLSLSPTLIQVLAHVVGAQTVLTYFANQGAPGFNVLGPVWTLSVEIAFYIVLPFVAMAFYRHPKAGLVTGAVIAVLWVQFAIHVQDVTSLIGLDISTNTALRIKLAVGTQFPFWIFSFALGMFGAKAFVYVRDNWDEVRIKRRAVQAQVGGLIGIVAFSLLIALSLSSRVTGIDAETVRYSPFVMLGYSASLATFMVATAFGVPWLQWFFGNRGIRWLAEISYGVYLSHAFFIWIGFWNIRIPSDTIPDGLVFLAFVLAASTAYGYLTARFFEQPIRRFARRYGRSAG